MNMDYCKYRNTLAALRQSALKIFEAAGMPIKPTNLTVSRRNIIVLVPRNHNQKADKIATILASAGLKDVRQIESYDYDTNVPLFMICGNW